MNEAEDFVNRQARLLELESQYQHLPDVPIVPDSELENKIRRPIADGTTRTVFHSSRPGRVIKKIRGSNVRENWKEYELWTAGRQTTWKSVLGEVFAISQSGNFLEMEYLGDLDEEDWALMPNLPDWLKDPKPKNIGKTVKGEIKSRDFALSNLTLPLGMAEVNVGAVDALKKVGPGWSARQKAANGRDL
jgi:hypothetical protein